MKEALNSLERFGNPIIQISLNDLREVVKELYEEERKRTEEAIKANRERATLTRKETAKMLGVTLSTLWVWAKSGYLTPVKIGTKVMYRPTDVDAMLEKQKGGVFVKKRQSKEKESVVADETVNIETPSNSPEPIREPLPEIEPDDLPF